MHYDWPSVEMVLSDLSEVLAQATHPPNDHNVKSLLDTTRLLNFEPVDFESHDNRDEASGCYLRGDGTLELNSAVLKKIEERAKVGSLIPHLPADIQYIYGVWLFALHEACHSLQGFIDFKDVQIIKHVSGYDQMVRIDLVADCISARLLAVIFLQTGLASNYKGALKVTFTLSLSLLLSVFKIDPAIKHKFERAISLFGIRHSLDATTENDDMLGRARYFQVSNRAQMICVHSLEESIERTILTRVLPAGIAHKLEILMKEGDLSEFHNNLQESLRNYDGKNQPD